MRIGVRVICEPFVQTRFAFCQLVGVSVVTVIETGTETAFFSNIEPYQNRGFMLSVDGFGMNGLEKLMA